VLYYIPLVFNPGFQLTYNSN